MKQIKNDSYLQIIICRGEAYRYLQEHFYSFNIHAYPTSYLDCYALVGAGAYFSPFTNADVECRCAGLWRDLCKEAKSIIFPKECDLTPMVKFLQMGGAGYGYPNYNA